MSTREKKWYSPAELAERADLGFVAVARTMGSGVSAVGRLLPFWQPKKAPARQKKEQSIAHAEAELDQIYAAIVRSAGRLGTAASLERLVQRARSLRSELEERRREPRRLKRHAARERSQTGVHGKQRSAVFDSGRG